MCRTDRFLNLQIVAQEDELIPAAEAHLERVLRFTDFGWQQTKAQFRAEFASEWHDYAEQEVDAAWKMLESQQVRGALEAYMKQLGSKRSKL